MHELAECSARAVGRAKNPTPAIRISRAFYRARSYGVYSQTVHQISHSKVSPGKRSTGQHGYRRDCEANGGLVTERRGREGVRDGYLRHELILVPRGGVRLRPGGCKNSGGIHGGKEEGTELLQPVSRGGRESKEWWEWVVNVSRNKNVLFTS